MDDLEVAAAQTGDWVVVTARGEVDLVTAPVLQGAVNAALATNHALIIDLSDVQFIDSTGLTVLILAQREVEAIGGSFKVVTGQKGPARKLLALTGVDQVLDTAMDVSTATNLPTASPSVQG